MALSSIRRTNIFRCCGNKTPLAINAITGSFPISFIESMIGVISLIIGLVSIIVLLALIGVISEKRRNYVITAIVLLLLFIGFELFASFYPGFAYLGGVWGNIAILVVYGILRGIALRRTNESLKSPRPGYGSVAFGIYAWSFLITTVLAFIFALIGGLALSITMITIALWIPIVLFFIEILCFVVIGIRFIQSAFLYPKITGPAPRPISTTTTTMVTPTTDPGTISVQTDSQDTKADDSLKTISDEPVKDKEYCANCGSIIDENTEVCESCGEARL